jgi:hypothetical protein
MRAVFSEQQHEISPESSRWALLRRGIGMHHPALSAGYRRALEYFFRCGQIGVGMATVDAAHQISDMQESRFVQTNVNEGRLHAGQHARYFAQVDIADQTTLQ